MYIDELEGKKVIVKERFAKKYRHPILEQKLSKSRLLHEAKCLEKAKLMGLDVPKVIKVDLSEKKLLLEYLEFPTLKRFLLDEGDNFKDVFSKLGAIVASLHNKGIVHGDLTTSNILIDFKSKEDVKLFLIDFGLAKLNSNVEDKAVDLYVFERALISTHPSTEHLFEAFLNTYETKSEPGKKETVVARFKKVQMRGRKKIALG